MSNKCFITITEEAGIIQVQVENRGVSPAHCIKGLSKLHDEFADKILAMVHRQRSWSHGDPLEDLFRSLDKRSPDELRAMHDFIDRNPGVKGVELLKAVLEFTQTGRPPSKAAPDPSPDPQKN